MRRLHHYVTRFALKSGWLAASIYSARLRRFRRRPRRVQRSIYR